MFSEVTKIIFMTGVANKSHGINPLYSESLYTLLVIKVSSDMNEDSVGKVFRKEQSYIVKHL